MNLPRIELLRHAQEAIEQFEEMGVVPEVHFKATCPACGARCTFEVPNYLFESMECAQCGIVSPVTEGGYALVLRSKPKPLN